jgi:cardiolipin synthase
MTIDSQWCVLGSTNFDHRSFALNDEVNLAALDPTLAQTLESDFTHDLTQSRPLTLETLRSRTPLGKFEAILEEPLETES